VAFVLAAPLTGRAAAPSLLLGLPGDQTWPSLLGNELTYVQQAGGIRDVALADMTDPANPVITPITTSGDVIWGPGLAGDYLSYRRPGEVGLYNTSLQRPFGNITAPGTGRAALSPALVAWEQEAAGGSDVAWLRLGAPGEAPIVMARAGSQRSVAASFGWIAYIDDADAGSVHLLDALLVNPTDPRTFSAADVRSFQGTLAGVGRVLDVAIWAADRISPPRLAVTVEGAAGAEIIVIGPDRPTPVALTTPGEKLNAHLMGEWVAYEDLSTGVSQVRLWQWTTGRLFYAAMTGSPQTLNQLVAVDAALTVIWTAMGAADLDIFQFTLGLPLPPGTGDGAVKCSDAAPIVLADFTVERQRDACQRSAVHDDEVAAPHAGGEQDRGSGHGNGDGDCLRDGHGRNDDWHVKETGARDERWHSEWKWRAFGGASFDADVPRHVLVCIDATDVTSAWVGVGSEVVAAPPDFHMGTLALEARLTVAADDGRAGAVVIARPGGRLRVRVLDDPGGSANGPSDGTTCSARGDCPPPPAGILSKLGCGSSGGAGGLASLLVTGLVAGGPLRRRRRF
jgi:hypothetical protein